MMGTPQGLSRRLRATLSGRTLLVGALIAFALLVLSIVDSGERVETWEDASLTIAAVTALAAGLLGRREASGHRLVVRTWLTVALATWAIARLGFDLQDELGVRASGDSPADIVQIATLIPTVIAFTVMVQERLSASSRFTLFLDSAAAFAAITAIMVVLLGGTLGSPGGLAGLLLVAGPALYFAVGGGGLVTALALRTAPTPPGIYALLLGTGFLGLGSTIWLARLGAGAVPESWTADLPISAGLLLAGLGAATWTDERDERPSFARLAGRLHAAMPLGATSIATILLLLREQVTVEAAQIPLMASAGAAIAITMVRQAALLAERERLLAERSAAAEAAGARVDLQRRLLAASRSLMIARVEEGAIDQLLAQFVPPGAIGFVARLDPGTGRLIVVSVVGPGTEGLARQRIVAAELTAENRRALAEGGAAGYRRAGEGGLPDGVIPMRCCFEWIRPDAASALALAVVDRAGAPLGVLSLIDPDAERVFEPMFLDMARVIANQLAVAFENQDLHDAVRAKLEELRRFQDRLVATAKVSAIAELAGAVAHELNNPLTGVLGNAELILMELGPDDPHRPEVEVIRSEALRARGVVRAMMEVMTPKPSARVSTDFGGIVRATVDLLRYHMQRSGIEIVESLDPLPPIELDPGAIQQVILHLIANAQHAMPGGGRLSIAARREDGQAVLTIADTGVGMDEETRRHAFEPFFTTGLPTEGAGLGLTVCATLVSSLGGTIALESEPGSGTTVEIRLPLVAPAAPAAEAAS